LVKALASQRTSPLPTKVIPVPSKPPADPADAVDSATRPPEPKKGVLPSLIRALTAKTVPMRTVSPTPVSRSTIAVTEPLPTRPISKPATPAPPPSEVNALTKRLGQMVLPDSGPTTPPTLGGPGDTEILPPPKSKSKSKPEPEPPRSVPPHDSDDELPSRTPAKRLLTGSIYASAAVALLILYYVWSPYHAASSLRNALNSGDPGELAATIDFPSVRASLKEQIKAQLEQPGLPGNTASGPASVTALTMLNQSVDRYITPEGISGLMSKSGVLPKDDPATVSPDVAAKILSAITIQPVKVQGLSSLNDFALDLDVAMLHLRWQGLGWKLQQVVLRPNLPVVSPVVDTFLERGDAMVKAGDGKGAIADFTEVLAIDPKSSAAYTERGAARAAAKDLEGAIADYTEALTIDPQMATAYEGRGNGKVAKNDLDGAIADYTKAINFDPTLAVAYDSRGKAKTAKNDLDRAIADFTQAISLDPNSANAYSDRGLARQANGNLDGAISDFTQALALKPKSARIYYNRGLALLTQGSPDVAIVDFDRALAFDPKMADAYFDRGNAKNATHDLIGAISDFTQAVTLDPQKAMAFCNRGLARQATGDLDGAQADFTQALVLNPKMVVAYYNRGLIEAQKNDLDGAISDSTQALYLDPKNAQAYYSRGFAKLIKGNLDGAAVDLKQFCDLAPKDANADRAHVYLWLIAKAQNPGTDADQALSDALEQSWNSSVDDPISKTAGFLLGRISEGDYLAIAVSTDEKTLQGLQCETWYFAAMKRLLMGDRATAISYFQKCVATVQTERAEFSLAQAELQALVPVAAPANPAAASGPANVPAPVKNP
jgi:tetratricopeptide (TPR) repeat protein